MQPIIENQTMLLKPHIFCIECNTGIPLNQKIGLDYFNGVLEACQSCGVKIEWKKVFEKNLQHPGLMSAILGPIGAHLSIIKIEMVPNKLFELRFNEHGIEKGSKILEMSFNSGAGFFPLEFTGNPPRRGDRPDVVYLYPMPLPGRLAEKPEEVSVIVTWMPPSIDDESWENIAKAYEHFGKKEFHSCIMPANVCVESKLGKILKHHLSKIASSDRVKRFLADGATYSHQLNILLPLVVNQCKLPKLSDEIRGSLNKLRDLRNQIAHDGKLEQELPTSDLAEMIASSLIAFHYLSIIDEKLNAP